MILDQPINSLIDQIIGRFFFLKRHLRLWVKCQITDKHEWLTDWLTDCLTDQCAHTSHLLVVYNTEYFPVAWTAAVNMCTVLKSKSQIDRTLIHIKRGGIKGRQSPFRGGKVVHWPRLHFSNREPESCRLSTNISHVFSHRELLWSSF